MPPGQLIRFMVITMTWMTKYHNRPEFLSWFESEQEYVDAMFVILIMHNFGIVLDPAKLRDENASCTP